METQVSIKFKHAEITCGRWNVDDWIKASQAVEVSEDSTPAF